MKYTGVRVAIFVDRLLRGLAMDVDAKDGKNERKAGDILLVRK